MWVEDTDENFLFKKISPLNKKAVLGFIFLKTASAHLLPLLSLR